MKEMEMEIKIEMKDENTSRLLKATSNCNLTVHS